SFEHAHRLNFTSTDRISRARIKFYGARGLSNAAQVDSARARIKSTGAQVLSTAAQIKSHSLEWNFCPRESSLTLRRYFLQPRGSSLTCHESSLTCGSPF